MNQEYEIGRVRRGVRAGDFVWGDEDPAVDFTRPRLYTEDLPEEVVAVVGGVGLPPSMRD